MFSLTIAYVKRTQNHSRFASIGQVRPGLSVPVVILEQCLTKVLLQLTYIHLHVACSIRQRFMTMKFLLSNAAIGVVFSSSDTEAACRCVCIGGELRAVCSSTLNIEPICPSRVCPIAPPSIEPIQAPRIPPLGTSDCVQRQIYNEQTGRYEWREVCY